MTTTPQPLAAWRVKRGLNVAELAREVLLMTSGETTVSEDTIRNIEAARTVPNVDTALALAQALGVTLNDVAWPTTAEVRANDTSRRNRYFLPHVQTAMFAAVFTVVSDQPPERRVPLDEALRRLEATLRNQNLNDDEIARAQARVRQIVEEERLKPRRRSPRQEVEALRVETAAFLAAKFPGWRVGDKVQQNVATDPRAEPIATFCFHVYNPLGFSRPISSREDLERLKSDLAKD